MAHEVFISYRRSISEDQAQILKLKIDEYFGTDTAFLDKDNIQIGSEWASTLKIKLDTAKVVIVIIGPKWVYTPFQFTDEDKGIIEGRRRIDHPEDWVCLEIEAGYQQNKAFPLYMGGGKIGEVDPKAMPASKPYLKAFFEKIQAVEISESQKKHEFIPIFELLEPKGLEKETSTPLSINKVVAPSPKITLHGFHKYTCDRREQLSQFEEDYDARTIQKVQFYYIQGKEEQAPFGFVNRVAYEKGGHLLDIDNEDKPTSLVLIEEIILENISGLAHLKKRLIREVLAELEINVNANDPILEKDLAFICRESPIIQGMNSSDYVSFQISIYEDEWDEEEIPDLIRWFVYEFCKLPPSSAPNASLGLPTTAPTFLFFFSIIYEEGDPEIVASVQRELEKAPYLKGLTELNMVSQMDIKRWFRKYRLIAPNSEERKTKIQTFFGEQEEFDMESVQIQLKKIIDQFNDE